MLLVAGEKPAALHQVHLQIIIEGSVYEKKFEPIYDLQYTYLWSRENMYKQKVYGTVKAKGLFFNQNITTKNRSPTYVSESALVFIVTNLNLSRWCKYRKLNFLILIQCY